MTTHHDPQYYEAQRVLNALPTDVATQLYKTTRAGATTGLCAVAADTGVKFTLVAPTIAITTDTIDDSKEYTDKDRRDIDVPNIPGNKSCSIIEDIVKKYPDLKHLSMIPLPVKCSECPQYNDCSVTEFLRSDSPDGVGLTHQKLNALMHSSSDMAKTIVDKLMDISDLIIIDEAHELEINNAATVCVYPFPNIEKYGSVCDTYPNISEFIDLFNDIRRNNEESVIHQLVSEREESMNAHMSIKINVYPDDDEYLPPEFRKVVHAIKDVVSVMKNRTDFNLSVSDVVYLNDVIMTLSGDMLVMHYISDDGIDKVQLSSPGGLRNSMREYILRLAMKGNCKVVFTTATFGDYYYGNIFGMNVNNEIMRDVCHTNEMMTIYPDKFKISTYNYWREEGSAYKPRIIKAIKEYEDKYPGIRFMCMKKTVANTIKKWLLADGYNIDVDYYRSVKTMGVKYDKRQMVCVGAPVTAINAHDGICADYNESQKTRENGNHAAFWQAISRAKDPMGKVPSHIFCIGIREDEIRKMCTWGVGRKMDMNGIRCDGVTVDDDVNGYIGSPNIVNLAAKKMIDIIKSKGSVDRSYLLRRMHISAKELDILLLNKDVAKYVRCNIKKPGRKAKKTYSIVDDVAFGE